MGSSSEREWHLPDGRSFTTLRLCLQPELDPEVSVTPLGGPNQDSNADHMNLTVYF